MWYWIKKAVNLFLFIASIIMLSWFIKGSLLNIYVIPTNSMSPTLKVGDYITVQKFPYLIKVPEHYPLSIVPFPYYSNKGFLNLEIDDIIVFYSPIEKNSNPVQNMTLIKRIRGIPGDTIYVHDRLVISKDSVNKYSEVKSFYAPKKGDSIILKKDNYNKWEKLIKKDGSSITIIDDQIVINNEPSNIYIFSNAFYFLTGDNTTESNDSRIWGPIPDNLIIGKAKRVIYRDKKVSNITL